MKDQEAEKEKTPRGFQTFWAHYPLKVGKLAAEKAFMRAVRRGATPDELMAGLDRYIANKPEWAHWCHPTTWLRQGRWMDETSSAPLTAGEFELARTVMKKRFGRCHHDPPCPNSLACLNAIAYELRANREGMV